MEEAAAHVESLGSRFGGTNVGNDVGQQDTVGAEGDFRLDFRRWAMCSGLGK
jgi:hypothetical protein